MAKAKVVTFATYLQDGRIHLQRRGFRSPRDFPVLDPGKDSINGGGMKSDDIIAELLREAREELGKELTLTAADFAYVGEVYDPATDRLNYVFRLVKGYDTLLKEQLTVEQAVDALCNPEGIGRSFMWLADLLAIRSGGLLTSISEKIFATFPELLSPARP